MPALISKIWQSVPLRKTFLKKNGGRKKTLTAFSITVKTKYSLTKSLKTRNKLFLQVVRKVTMRLALNLSFQKGLKLSPILKQLYYNKISLQTINGMMKKLSSDFHTKRPRRNSMIGSQQFIRTHNCKLAFFACLAVFIIMAFATQVAGMLYPFILDLLSLYWFMRANCYLFWNFVNWLTAVSPYLAH